ncbi:TetR/AcrR family transcriptional regulator [Modestobacter marinus]|uniref:AcrR family transcriptional regulator n=1 Tax=Modestobacter marinus TaxID=477641 RepID=A0A846LEN0_9ACTN|nr:TetR/AcrR family transcriptional regulator [Modestobacter marinus]NIH66613.1 AcrR family transcriptional regulator [Modestobacter marinus]GGL47703.1 TetR family transcriptional regulator [Modestobacter marinus]
MTPDAVRPAVRRADAERNRERILAAARQGFAEPGAPLSMAEVARRAGVGMATLYRNFPGRRELLEALYTDQVDDVCAAAASVAGSPGDALVAWVHRFASFIASKHELAAELLAQTDGPGPVLDRSRERVLAAGRPLLAAAQAAGDVRGDLTLEQVLDMVIAVSAIHGDPDYSRPILATALDGLRAR